MIPGQWASPVHCSGVQAVVYCACRVALRPAVTAAVSHPEDRRTASRCYLFWTIIDCVGECVQSPRPSGDSTTAHHHQIRWDCQRLINGTRRPLLVVRSIARVLLSRAESIEDREQKSRADKHLLCVRERRDEISARVRENGRVGISVVTGWGNLCAGRVNRYSPNSEILP